MKKYFSKWLLTFSGSLKLFFTILVLLFSHISYASNNIADTANYLPGGQYRMFGGGRGTVSNVKNNIHSSTSSVTVGAVQFSTQHYSGSVSYQQDFSNHGWRVHSPFSSSLTQSLTDFHGSIDDRKAGVVKGNVKGYEVHPADGYEGEQGGGYPSPTGARDEYTYEVSGTMYSVGVLQPENAKTLPETKKPYNQKAEDNKLPENNPADANDRTRDLVGSGNLPNTLPESGDITENNGEVPLPKASGWKDILDGGLGFADGLAKSFFDEAKTTADVVTHPVDTTKNLANAAKTVANNPTSVGKAVQQTFADAIDEKVANYDKAQTAYQRGFEVGTISVAIVGAVLPSSAAGKAKAVTEVAKAVDKASDAADAAKKANDLAKAQDRINDLSRTQRPGKSFTPAQKDAVKNENRIRNDGVTKCENCGVETVPAQKHQSGVTPPSNETHIDHVVPKSKGGSGTADNGQVLCRNCNLQKGNK